MAACVDAYCRKYCLCLVNSAEIVVACHCYVCKFLVACQLLVCIAYKYGITLHIGADLPHGAIFWDEIGPSWGKVALSWGYLRPFGPSWGNVAPSWSYLRPSLGLPWATFCNFRTIEGHLGVCPCLLGPFLGEPGVCLGHLGTILDFPGAILEPSWGILGPSSGHLEAKLGCERTGEKRKAKGRTEIGQFRKKCTAPRREHRFPCSGARC